MGSCARGACVVPLALLPLGCLKSVPKTVAVSGRVTMDKRPLPNADISFCPIEYEQAGKRIPEASGRTDADGRFALKLSDGTADGAVVGPSRVRVSIFDRGGDGRPGKGQLIPPRYNRETKLTFDVPPGGTSEANFDLTSGFPPATR